MPVNHANTAIQLIKESIWKQFGASIDMLINAIELCSDELMQSNKRLFYITYHVCVFLDYYLTLPPNSFPSSLPFTFTKKEHIPEEAVDDVIPNRFYTKTELLEYVKRSKNKCYNLISGLNEQTINNRFVEDNFEDGMNYNVVEILLYNMRHVQHHAAQLNMMLRHEINTAPTWVARAKETI